MEQNIEDIINMQALPEHVAIIMDGNRRWAKKNNLSTPQGHKEGAEKLKRIAFLREKYERDQKSIYHTGLSDGQKQEAIKIIKNLINQT